ncbi:LysR family transcriptional regulator [Mycobacterium sp. IS-1590]|uniref:LysR substrate-binding domain-containing protein n=1 Tax=Mycobacterium sp. IS-1590 TaxID=1772286 RepID=UPI00074A5848|nr:LysR substrate-binding domain-containing protein [Mycobacterium sp. IS-1590]KUI34451.1 LysR family transcriptional regulator [Mycobacterium sp. IS-1590]
MFDVRRLVVLREVVSCGSLSAAAAALNYTTSAVSQQITALERDIGSTLLVRSPSGARPTAAGTRLLEHAGVIIAAVMAAERDLAQMAGFRPGAVRVASFATAAATLLPRAIVRFRALCPDIDIELVPADPEKGVGMLAAGDVDAAVITEVPGEDPEFPRVHTDAVYDDEFYAVLPAAHRLAAASAVPFAALADERWIVSTETGVCPDVRVFEKACRKAGFVPSVTFRAEDYSTVQGLVAADLGVSLVPSLAAHGGVHPDVTLRRIAGGAPVRRIGVATPRESAVNTPLTTFVSLVRSAGAHLRAQTAYSVAERPFSVA